MYSDGVASVSVFVEMQTRVQRRGTEKQNPPPTGVARVGSSSAFSTMVDGAKVTIVGEVPPATVESIGNSVKSTAASSGGLSLKAPPRR